MDLKQLTVYLPVLLPVENVHPCLWKALSDGQMDWAGGGGSELRNAETDPQNFLLFPAPLPESIYQVWQL